MADRIPPGPLSEPAARTLTRALDWLRALRRMRTAPPLALTWNEGQPQLYLAGDVGGSDTSFLVLLTEKVWSATFRQYSAVEVEASGSLAYAVKAGGRTFSPGTTPLYHERNHDFPVVGLSAGSPRFVHRLSVVRARQHPNGFWYFGEDAWSDIFRRTGVTDAGGEQAYHRYNSANTGLTWADGTEVRLIEAE